MINGGKSDILKSKQIVYLAKRISNKFFQCPQSSPAASTRSLQLPFVYVCPRDIPYGLAVRIPGFHPGGPGSTPGMGTHFLSVQTMFLSVTQAS